MITPVRLDYADWLTPARLEAEEVAWASSGDYKSYAAAITKVRQMDGRIAHVTEFGCGTGLVPPALPDHAPLIPGIGRGDVVLPSLVKYIGVDRNAGCVEKARARNAHLPWVTIEQMELRTVKIGPATDLACAFAVLKHFPLAEWDALFRQWFSQARWAIFTVPLAETSYEDGREFTHTWRSMREVREQITLASHVVVAVGDHAVEPIFITKRVETGAA